MANGSSFSINLGMKIFTLMLKTSNYYIKNFDSTQYGTNLLVINKNGSIEIKNLDTCTTITCSMDDKNSNDSCRIEYNYAIAQSNKEDQSKTLSLGDYN